MAEYKLSTSLQGHEDDVRAVVFPTHNTIYSASRDGTVRKWQQTSSKPITFDDTIVVEATSFINSLAILPASTEYPQGLIASGGKDTIIDVRKPDSPSPQNAERLLVGHANNVCTLDGSSDGKTLISGGWDQQVRVWDIAQGETIKELKGHDASVWAVLSYDADHIITGCADKHVRIFHSSGKLIKDIGGLPDVVRALCKLPTGHESGAAFASAGNDQIIRLWTLDGDEMAQLHGHEAFIYSLAASSNGDIFSASEDRTLRVWKNGQCIQTITHPAISVWSVAVCAENGDIVTGSSDRVVRVFSRDSHRQADQETQQAFADSVKASSIPQETTGNGQKINKETLPGPDFLQSKSGTKEGQVQMIKEDDGSVTAYTWSSAAQQWINVGTVVESSGSSDRKVTHNGQDYDYVFDVDIEDGKPALKLPYNTSQNPYEAAQKFIADNELPVTYIEQVANFVIQNSKATTIGSSSGTSGVSGVPGSDPWGTENRYRPGEVGAPTIQNPTRAKVLPQTQYLSISSANLPAIRRKINELEVNEGTAERLSDEDKKNLDHLVKQLQSSPSSPRAQSNQIEVVLKMILTWSPASKLPALDLLRLCAIDPGFAAMTSAGEGTIVDTLVSANCFSTTDEDRLNDAMMAVRVLANQFNTEEGLLIADGTGEQVIELVKPFVQSNNKNLTFALATLFINFAVLTTTSAPVQESVLRDQRGENVAHLAIQLIDRQVDSETTYRNLVAFGTLLCLGKEFRSEELSKEKLNQVISKVLDGPFGKESRVKGIIGEIKDELNQ